MQTWAPSSWRQRAALQQPRYEDPAALEAVLARLRRLPPIVSVGEIEDLKAQLAAASRGERFLLQGGDCAERFDDCNADSIVRKLKILLQMSLVLTYGARKPVIRLGRIAGQFAKPRSKDTETIGGVELPSYRGDNVNDLAADPVKRRPDPARLEQGYFSSAATLNFIRALVEGGFANLRAPEHWALDFIPRSGEHAAYREIADRIRDTIDYFESLGGVGNSVFREVDFFISHEGLLLPYEESFTRTATNELPYNVGAHFLWIGERTRQLDGAHVEYFRGLANPIGIKVGPTLSPEELLKLIEVLDPGNEPGRITLITRFGSKTIARALPPLVRAVRGAGKRVVWSCDPMHGNTISIDGGVKTREYHSIVSELATAFDVHRAEGSQLSGVHFELTGDNVTECLGGVEGLSSADLGRQYQTGCDPRLNYAQSIEIAFLISKLLQAQAAPPRPPPPAW